MTLTLDISPETEQRLQRGATQAGLPLDELVVGILEEAGGDAGIPKTGAELVALWDADGLFGAWADREDIKDSAEYARRLRQQAEHRDWTE
jgi:hypothetical protein